MNKSTKDLNIFKSQSPNENHLSPETLFSWVKHTHTRMPSFKISAGKNIHTFLFLFLAESNWGKNYAIFHCSSMAGSKASGGKFSKVFLYTGMADRPAAGRQAFPSIHSCLSWKDVSDARMCVCMCECLCMHERTHVSWAGRVKSYKMSDVSAFFRL